MYTFIKIKDASVTTKQAEEKALDFIITYYRHSTPSYKAPNKLTVEECKPDEEGFLQINASSVFGLKEKEVESIARESLEKFFGDIAKVNKMPNYGKTPNQRHNSFRMVGFKIIPSDNFIQEIKEYLETLEPDERYEADYEDLIKFNLEKPLGDYEFEEKDED